MQAKVTCDKCGGCGLQMTMERGCAEMCTTCRGCGYIMAQTFNIRRILNDVKVVVVDGERIPYSDWFKRLVFRV